MWYMILSFVISTALVMLAFAQTRNFVTRRLRYVDAVQSAITAGQSSTGAMSGSTEDEQFKAAPASDPARAVA